MPALEKESVIDSSGEIGEPVLLIPGPRQSIQARQGGQKLIVIEDAMILLAADGMSELLFRPAVKSLHSPG